MEEQFYNEEEDEDYVPGVSDEDEEEYNHPTLDDSEKVLTRKRARAKNKDDAQGKRKFLRNRSRTHSCFSDDETLGNSKPNEDTDDKEADQRNLEALKAWEELKSMSSSQKISKASTLESEGSNKSPVANAEAASGSSVVSDNVSSAGNGTKTTPTGQSRFSSRFASASSPSISLKLPGEDEALKKKKEKIVYDFAGEKVEIDRVVKEESVGIKVKSSDQSIEEILGLKKNKISTTQKSHLDWEKFKEKEGIAEELANQAKDGYLEKQDFLQRTDLRQFERELETRKKQRSLLPNIPLK